MFVEALREVVENTDGALAGLLMDSEGIPVERYVKKGATFDIEGLGAEFSVIVKSVQRTVKSLDVGVTKEVAVQADKITALIRVLTPDYFVAVALQPGANLGKGRYLLRLAVPRLVAELT